jgi:uncharacterized protein (TIGR03067 family)
MNRSLGIWVALAMCRLVAADTPLPSDQDRIQGTWVMVGREVDGQAEDAATLTSQARMIFDKNRILVKMGSMIAELGTFSLDPTKAPKHYNRTYGEGTPREGIYELEGDTLKICLAEIGKPRPTSLATKPGEGTSLLIYKRESP